MSALVPAFLGAWPDLTADPGPAARLLATQDWDAPPTAEILRAVAAWVAADFSAAGEALLEIAGPEAIAAVAAPRTASVALHAGLVGLGGGAARDAFAWARERQIRDRRLIDLDLASARLSAIAIDQTVGELQLARLCDLCPALPAAEDERATLGEIRRTAILVVTESAHVWGGHGFVGADGPAARGELMQAILGALRRPG